MTQKPQYLPGDRTSPDSRTFPWGPIDAVHRIGNFQIVEYRSDKSNSTQSEYWHEHGETMFHPYINWKDTNRSYTSLESALVGAVGVVREGPNGRAAEYFDRMTLPARKEV